MSIHASGLDNLFQLGIKSTIKKSSYECVDTFSLVPFDVCDIDCISSGAYQTVIIKRKKVYATGDDKNFIIGSDNRKIYEDFTEINICNEDITWAACGLEFTLYLTVCGSVILCHSRARCERIRVPLSRKAVSVFAGQKYGAIVDEDGFFYILDEYNPHKEPIKYSLGLPVVDIACCFGFIAVLLSNGRVFGNGKLNNNSNEFAVVPSLEGVNIMKISGYAESCAVLSSDGRVYVYGKNDHGQLCDGTVNNDYSGFKEVSLLGRKEIKDVSISHHILFLTQENEVYGCGYNYYSQLFQKTIDCNITKPVYLTSLECDKVCAFQCHSFILSGCGKLENPAKLFFSSQINPNKDDRNVLLEKFHALVKICQSQSDSINELKNLCEYHGQKIEELTEKLDTVIAKMNDDEIW